MVTVGWARGSLKVGWEPGQSTSAAGMGSPGAGPGLQQLLLLPDAESAEQGWEQGGCPHAASPVGPVPWVWLKAEGAGGEGGGWRWGVGTVGGWGQKHT